MARGWRYLEYCSGVVLLVALLAMQQVAASHFVALSRTRTAERMLASDGYKGEECLKQAIEIEPSLGLPHWLLSKEYFRRGTVANNMANKLKEQLAVAQQAQPSAAVQLLAKFRTAESVRKEMLARAEREARQGIRTYNSLEYSRLIASIFLEMGYKAEASRYLNIVLQLKPDDMSVAEQLGLVYLHSEKFDELLALCERIAQKQPHNPNVFYYRAYVADKRGNTAEMQRNLIQAYYAMLQGDQRVYFDPKQIIDRIEGLGMIKAGDARTSGKM